MDRKSIVSESSAMDEHKHGERDGSVDVSFVSGTNLGKIETSMEKIIKCNQVKEKVRKNRILRIKR